MDHNMCFTEGIGQGLAPGPMDVQLGPPAPGPLFTKKTPFYQYRDSHNKPETVVRPS